jgi:hypothetical protein
MTLTNNRNRIINDLDSTLTDLLSLIDLINDRIKMMSSDLDRDVSYRTTFESGIIKLRNDVRKTLSYAEQVL